VKKLCAGPGEGGSLCCRIPPREWASSSSLVVVTMVPCRLRE
jgi:hypothetical protein